MTVYDYGVDIEDSCSFKDGDLVLASYNDNLVQAIRNRLNTDLSELDLFYEEYGSIVTGFFGWRRVESTLSHIKSEVDNCLKNDPRLQVYDTTVQFNTSGAVEINITVYPAILTMNFVLTEKGIEINEG